MSTGKKAYSAEEGAVGDLRIQDGIAVENYIENLEITNAAQMTRLKHVRH